MKHKLGVAEAYIWFAIFAIWLTIISIKVLT